MKPIIFKHKRLIVENVSPFWMAILEMQKQREEIARAYALKVIRKEGLKMDREIIEAG